MREPLPADTPPPPRSIGFFQTPPSQRERASVLSLRTAAAPSPRGSSLVIRRKTRSFCLSAAKSFGSAFSFLRARGEVPPQRPLHEHRPRDEGHEDHVQKNRVMKRRRDGRDEQQHQKDEREREVALLPDRRDLEERREEKKVEHGLQERVAPETRVEDDDGQIQEPGEIQGEVPEARDAAAPHAQEKIPEHAKIDEEHGELERITEEERHRREERERSEREEALLEERDRDGGRRRHAGHRAHAARSRSEEHT